MDIQGKKKTVELLTGCHEANANIPEEQLESLRYVPPDFDNIHIRVFSDASFQNLPDRHPQIGFIFVLSDGNDKCNLFH